jgi:hypothetical protein
MQRIYFVTSRRMMLVWFHINVCIKKQNLKQTLTPLWMLPWKKRVKHSSSKFFSDNFSTSATSSTVSKPESYSAFFNTRAQCLITFYEKVQLAHVASFKVRRTRTAQRPVPEIIDLVFAKTSQNARFLLSENERFGLVFVKTGSINSGTGNFVTKENRNDPVQYPGW